MMARVEVVIVNLTAKARDATLHGRPYKVAPATMIVPGVLPGSQGPLLYTPDETRRNPDSWNGMPLLLGHPVENGTHVSGRSPAVWERQGLGHIYETSADEAGRLRAEAWFDVERTRALAPHVLAALEAGTPVELSTGLYLDSEPAAPGATHNGTAYGHVARNFRPDHLAVLVGEKGACSVEQGCGILANAEQKSLGRWLLDLFRRSKVGTVANADAGLPSEKVDPDKACQILHDGQANGEPLTDDQRKMFAAACDEKKAENATQNRGETTVDKKALVSWLTTNCDCWKGSEAVLNGMSEDALKRIKADADKVRTLNVIVANKKATKRLLTNADGVADGEVAPGINIGDLAKFLGVETDPGQDPAGFIRDILAKLDEIEQRLGDEPEPPEAPDDVTAADVAPTAMSATPTGNRGKKMTANQWLATAPPEIQSAVRSAMEIERAERTRLVRQLTANVADEARRKKLWAKFMAQPVDELRDLVSLLPEREEPEPAANYFGAAGVADDGGRDDSNNLLPVFNVDRAEFGAEGLRQKKQA